MKPFTNHVKQLFEEYSASLCSPDGFGEVRRKALSCFLQKGLPDKKTQGWQKSALERKVRNNYSLKLKPDEYRPLEEFFKCRIHDLNPIALPMLNGWFVPKEDDPCSQGIIACGLIDAIRNHPNLVLPLLRHENIDKENGLIALNEAFFSDGVFIHIPDNTKVEIPFQIVSIVNTKDNCLINNKFIVSLGKNAEATLIHCDDSIERESSFTNNVTEVFMGENSRLNYYKTENKDADSILVNSLFVHQQSGSKFRSTAITFNAGFVCNIFNVNLNKPYAEAELNGLYLVDKQQSCDNHIFINHAASDCVSRQMYKGIMDDEASANFHGHILVAPDSQRTAAFQTNRNLLLTDKAHVTTKPFLEIYADDVQCSHGATVGQLDEEALYYLRTRGIGEAAANRLLMFAFANDIVQNVEIEALRDRLSNMVQHRLQGELNVCSQCMLSDDITFPIKL